MPSPFPDPSIRDEALVRLSGLIAKVTVRLGDGYVEQVVEGPITQMIARSQTRSGCCAPC